MKKWPIETQVLAGFALALGVLAAVGILAYQFTTHFIATSHAVSRARAVGADRPRGCLFAHEPGGDRPARGYLILGDKADLIRREAAVARLNEQNAERKQLLTDNPAIGG